MLNGSYERLNGIKNQTTYFLILSDLTNSEECFKLRNDLVLNHFNNCSQFSIIEIENDSDTVNSNIFTKLYKFLSKKRLGGEMPDFKSPEPIIIHLSDKDDPFLCHENEFALLNKLYWFNHSIKYEINVGQKRRFTKYSIYFVGRSGEFFKCNKDDMNGLVIKIIQHHLKLCDDPSKQSLDCDLFEIKKEKENALHY